MLFCTCSCPPYRSGRRPLYRPTKHGRRRWNEEHLLFTAGRTEWERWCQRHLEENALGLRAPRTRPIGELSIPHKAANGDNYGAEQRPVAWRCWAEKCPQNPRLMPNIRLLSKVADGMGGRLNRPLSRDIDFGSLQRGSRPAHPHFRRCAGSVSRPQSFFGGFHELVCQRGWPCLIRHFVEQAAARSPNPFSTTGPPNWENFTGSVRLYDVWCPSGSLTRRIWPPTSTPCKSSYHLPEQLLDAYAVGRFASECIVHLELRQALWAFTKTPLSQRPTRALCPYENRPQLKTPWQICYIMERIPWIYADVSLLLTPCIRHNPFL